MTWCSSTPQENNPDVAFPYESHHPYERKNPESRVVVLYLNEFEKRHIFRASPVSCCWWLKTFFGRADFDVSVRFEHTVSCRRCSTTWSLAAIVYLVWFWFHHRAMMGTYYVSCSGVLADCAVLCCAAVDGRRRNILAQELGVLVV